MKKSLFIGLTLSSTLLLTACGTPTTPENVEPETTTGTDQQTVLPPENEITMTCSQAIQDYLDTAKNAELGSVEIKENDAIVVDYIGRLADGSVFDTSVESVAKACGAYNEQRNYTEGLSFTAGAGQMIKGFDKAVLGMKVNETKTINIPAAEAYGEYNPQLVVSFSTEGIDTQGFAEGIQIMTPDGVPATITKLTDKEITLDYNSALAGKDLIFDITIKSIN